METANNISKKKSNGHLNLLELYNEENEETKDNAGGSYSITVKDNLELCL